MTEKRSNKIIRLGHVHASERSFFFSNSPMLFQTFRLSSKKRLKTFYLPSRGDLINAGNVVPDSFLIWILRSAFGKRPEPFAE